MNTDFSLKIMLQRAGIGFIGAASPLFMAAVSQLSAGTHVSVTQFSAIGLAGVGGAMAGLFIDQDAFKKHKQTVNDTPPSNP